MRAGRWWWLGGFVLGAIGLGLAIGAVPLPARGLWRGLTDPGAPEAVIVRALRLPRVLLGFLVGGSLAVCGAVLQAVVRNPLADPYLLGLSAGGALGAVAAIAAGVQATWAVPLAAFLGALATLALVYRVSLIDGRRLDSHILLLAGVVVSAFAMALVAAALSLSSAARLQNAFLWMLGGLWTASWTSVAVLAMYGLPPLALLMVQARALDLMALGEDNARHLGVDPERVKRVALLATGLLTAVAVASCGLIGFVGLIVPHAVRRLFGTSHLTLLPASFLLGGGLLVLADALARRVATPLELPVGVVTALLGVPLFALLLRRSLA